MPVMGFSPLNPTWLWDAASASVGSGRPFEEQPNLLAPRGTLGETPILGSTPSAVGLVPEQMMRWEMEGIG